VLIRIGHSADPDDAFMAWGLVSGRVDPRGFEFEFVPEDIQVLNEWALEGKLEVTALSLATYPLVQDRYALLPHGASIGSGYGPIVVARKELSLDVLRHVEIAVPGRLTTAFLVLGMALGGGFAHRALPFDRILDAVKSGDAEAGLLIHEGQLTFGDRGLHLVADMGVWWFEETGLPLPLGGNVVRKDLGPELTQKISRHLRASIAYGLDHRKDALDHSMQYARGLDRSKADTFVGMYVNDWTLDYGPRGREAVRLFLKKGVDMGLITTPVDVEFVD
jgi:1,4-dihydroxy-6-naphthoate synthase